MFSVYRKYSKENYEKLKLNYELATHRVTEARKGIESTEAQINAHDNVPINDAQTGGFLFLCELLGDQLKEMTALVDVAAISASEFYRAATFASMGWFDKFLVAIEFIDLPEYDELFPVSSMIEELCSEPKEGEENSDAISEMLDYRMPWRKCEPLKYIHDHFEHDEYDSFSNSAKIEYNGEVVNEMWKARQKGNAKEEYFQLQKSRYGV